MNTALNQVSDERFGFTQDEVAGLAAYLGRADKLDDLRAWYDGYRFGAADIYNPWSVLSFFARGCVCQPYWLNTSSNTVLDEAQRGNDPYVLNDLLSLLEPGATVEHPIDPNIAYGDLGSDPEAVWSVLYMSGYLTTDDTDFPDDSGVVRRLRVPNAEVRTAFRREVADRARKAAGGMGRLGALHRAILSGNEQAFGRELGFIARNSASYCDLTNEAACHMMVFGLLFGMPGYGDPLSNREAGYGRYDIQVMPADPTSGLPCVTVEVKFLHPEDAQDLGEKTSEALAALAREALGRSPPRGTTTPRRAFAGAWRLPASGLRWPAGRWDRRARKRRRYPRSALSMSQRHSKAPADNRASSPAMPASSRAFSTTSGARSKACTSSQDRSPISSPVGWRSRQRGRTTGGPESGATATTRSRTGAPPARCAGSRRCG